MKSTHNTDESQIKFPIHELTRAESMKHFPQLHEIPQAPQRLFYKGNISQQHSNQKYLCIVGSRKNTDYGKEVCQHLIQGLSGHHITIVSGLAYGIDSIAHQTALDHDMQTYAFPGSGLDDSYIYPRQHVSLANDICDAGGALISEYPAKMPSLRYMFPQRNRLMVGMSDAILMIEGAEKSGTLITARLTSEYNRDLLVVPGNIFSQQSHGPHHFMKMGAYPITSSRDIIDILFPEHFQHHFGQNEVQKEGQNDEQRSEHISAQSSQKHSLFNNIFQHTHGNEKIILELLQNPHTIESLHQKTNITIQELNTIIMKYELENHITKQDQYYVLNQ